MATLRELKEKYNNVDCQDLTRRQLKELRENLQNISPNEIRSATDGELFVNLLRTFREAVAENDKLNGDNYPDLLKSLLSVGEDGVYSDSLRFIFELIQNVDDCEFKTRKDAKLDIYFDYRQDTIVLTYNEKGFTPFNVFSITGIAEKAKNISNAKDEIGEKGIGFKSVFGVTEHVLIQSGWFSFKLYKNNFTIPVPVLENNQFCQGTKMTLFAPGQVKKIYDQIQNRYCNEEALFSKNPILFLRRLTSLRFHNNIGRSMEFTVSRGTIKENFKTITRENDVIIKVNFQDIENDKYTENIEQISCTRYTLPVHYDYPTCQSRYGDSTKVGLDSEKIMYLAAIVPCVEDMGRVGEGRLYSFLPTQLAFTVPIVCHAPFKLDASREFVDPQNKFSSKENIWFKKTKESLSILMDAVFKDWVKEVKQKIVYYLPPSKKSLFAKNNGKEDCLRLDFNFYGNHYLQLPLFETVNGVFKPASEIFCFDSTEKILEPVKASRLLELSNSLFLAPENFNTENFGIKQEKNVYNRLFKRAMQMPSLTNEILDYLDKAKYEYNLVQLLNEEDIKLTASQIICIMRHQSLAEKLMSYANNAVRKSQRLKLSICEPKMSLIKSVLYDGFDLNETTMMVENYMVCCGSRAFCLDISEDQYLPCRNGIVLSKKNVLSSFAAFCYAIDPSGTFAIRVKLHEASNRLDECIKNNSGSAADYLRNLQNIRLTVKDSLGTAGYKSYLDLILKSGRDRTRFIQELLQNADDCNYPEGSVPSFSLSQKENRIVTEYNEVGFNRENIRSITAIGESTKNRILNKDLNSIGEKGVGFKTIFAIASEVKIYSGEYNFSLSADAPTIPRPLTGVKETVRGTKMEITLRDKTAIKELKNSDILELCLCLRKLREIEINGTKVKIIDADTTRTVIIDGRSYTFRRYIRNFTITDEKALAEKANGTKSISPKQKIVCYVPEKMSSADFPLYNGLPTRHRIKIPIAIDAPFELTTSREEIEEDCVSWNNTIRDEMYNAIVDVIHSRKTEDRVNVLKFVKVRFQLSGNQRFYANDLSDSQYLSKYDYIGRLRKEEILPTFDRNKFVSASSKSALIFPEVATWLLDKLTFSDYCGILPENVLDTNFNSLSKDQREHVESVLSALSCEEVKFYKVFPLLLKHAETYIENDEFRTLLYEYLQAAPETCQVSLCNLKIIPVYGENGGSQFIHWVDEKIFVKKGANTSDQTYWVLNESLLSKSMCEKMLGVNINEMNAEWERNSYRSNLIKILKGTDMDSIYRFLIKEYASCALEGNDCLGILLQYKEYIPLKNELGEIKDTELFLSSQPVGYFAVNMLQSITVHKECAGLAKYIKCTNLSDIYYDDLGYYEQLTAEDVESLQDEYFKHSEEILRGFYREGYLSENLLKEYHLEYLGMEQADASYDHYSFPENPVRDRSQLVQHVRSILKSPVSVSSEKVEQSVLIGRKPNGESFKLNGTEARDRTLQIYTLEEDRSKCFCQMCLRIKPRMLMEVNNIELRPKFYFPQTRVALCLECSKLFESLRDDKMVQKAYLNAIRNANTSFVGKVTIPVGRYSLTFTARHLAEIQELLKGMPQ